MTYSSYAAIGDSFTEGVGDELPDGAVRGWADLVALGLAHASSEPVTYANLAIRGRLLEPIITGQLAPAIALKPALLSINGGGNDILRPRVSITGIADRLEAAVDQAVDSGCHVLLISGGNPSRHIPLGSLVQARGEQFAEAIRRRLPKSGVTFVDNWADTELRDIRYWSRDRLHLGASGHRRVAATVLAALGIPAADDPGRETMCPDASRSSAYWRDYVFPWIGRRLTGRSSGDHREPKGAVLAPVRVPRT